MYLHSLTGDKWDSRRLTCPGLLSTLLADSPERCPSSGMMLVTARRAQKIFFRIIISRIWDKWLLSDIFPFQTTSQNVVVWYFPPVVRAQNLVDFRVLVSLPSGHDQSSAVPGCQMVDWLSSLFPGDKERRPLCREGAWMLWSTVYDLYWIVRR